MSIKFVACRLPLHKIYKILTEYKEFQSRKTVSKPQRRTDSVGDVSKSRWKYVLKKLVIKINSSIEGRTFNWAMLAHALNMPEGVEILSKMKNLLFKNLYVYYEKKVKLNHLETSPRKLLNSLTKILNNWILVHVEFRLEWWKDIIEIETHL